MINVGQIYSYKKIGNFVITNITEEKISRIWQDGCERKASRCLTFWKWSQEGLRLIVIPKTLFG